jgi:hypothetical protein
MRTCWMASADAEFERPVHELAEFVRAVRLLSERDDPRVADDRPKRLKVLKALAWLRGGKGDRRGPNPSTTDLSGTSVNVMVASQCISRLLALCRHLARSDQCPLSRE